MPIAKLMQITRHCKAEGTGQRADGPAVQDAWCKCLATTFNACTACCLARFQLSWQPKSSLLIDLSSLSSSLQTKGIKSILCRRSFLRWLAPATVTGSRSARRRAGSRLTPTPHLLGGPGRGLLVPQPSLPPLLLPLNPQVLLPHAKQTGRPLRKDRTGQIQFP